ncbi:MAG: serine/threonine protein kinase [Sedimentitalea sp.]
MTDDHALDEALKPGTQLLNGQYTIVRYLSSGGFGITYLARDSLERMVVIKECFPDTFCSRVNKTVQARSRSHHSDFRAFVALFVREARSLSKLTHPHVVGVHQVFEDNETAYMALDLIDGQDLLELIETGEVTFTPEQIKLILLKLLDAVALVHDQDMLHRDISPDNILIDKSGAPVLIDFGAAREEASKKSRVLSTVLVVKDGYSPQEFYIAGSQQSPASDLYALAATFFHLIAGQAPPNSQARLAAIASNAPDPYPRLAGRFDGFDPGFLQAIDQAMNVFPGDRIATARDWIARIDGSRPQMSAGLDPALEQTLTQLVQSENQIQAAQARRTPTKSAAMRLVERADARDAIKPKKVARNGPTIAETRKRACTPAPIERDVPDYIAIVRQACQPEPEPPEEEIPPPPEVVEVDYEKLSKHMLAVLIICVAVVVTLFSGPIHGASAQSLLPEPVDRTVQTKAG